MFYLVKGLKHSVQNFDKFAKGPMPYRTKVERSLRSIHKDLGDYFMKNGSYIGFPGVIPQHPAAKYKIGVIDYLPELKYYCPQCEIKPSIYAVGAVGNIDDDPFLDVVVITDDGSIRVVNDDITDSTNPMPEVTSPLDVNEADQAPNEKVE